MTSRKKSKEPSPSDQFLSVKGWQLFAHPLFLDQLEKLTKAVQKERTKNPSTYKRSANAKLLAAIFKLAFETVPEDPTRPEYRQGNTLGEGRKHWFRVKFGGQRFRLFFRYSSKAKVIVYAWVNDSETLRTYGARTDAYAVFSGMLNDGHPPDEWYALMGECSMQGPRVRLSRAMKVWRAP